nr:hypothetical protein CFP56_07417 [Quercus suber]
MISTPPSLSPHHLHYEVLCRMRSAANTTASAYRDKSAHSDQGGRRHGCAARALLIEETQRDLGSTDRCTSRVACHASRWGCSNWRQGTDDLDDSAQEGRWEALLVIADSDRYHSFPGNGWGSLMALLVLRAANSGRGTGSEIAVSLLVYEICTLSVETCGKCKHVTMAPQVTTYCYDPVSVSQDVGRFPLH